MTLEEAINQRYIVELKPGATERYVSTYKVERGSSSIYVAKLHSRTLWALRVEKPGMLDVLAYFRSFEAALEFCRFMSPEEG